MKILNADEERKKNFNIGMNFRAIFKIAVITINAVTSNWYKNYENENQKI